MSREQSFADTLHRLSASGNMRHIPQVGQRLMLDFSTNDYLGLASRTDLQERFFASEDNRRLPMSSSASRLLCAVQEEYSRLESLLTGLYGRPALLFNSGYHANVGIVSALASKGTLIVADKLVHASIIDGITLSKAPFERFRHNDYNHLERILSRHDSNYERVLLIVESVYSMDGDCADIERLIDIRNNYDNVLLYIDEAHAVGVNGPQGLGLAKASARFDDVDIVVGTFGKALASQGAFCVVSDTLRQYLVNTSRPFIFSTAIAPINCAWTRFVIEQMIAMDAERSHLSSLCRQLHQGLSAIAGAETTSRSHIQPLIVGDAEKAVALSQELLQQDIKVLPIRTPTVPPGTERLRISLSAANTAEDVNRLLNALAKL